MTNNNYIAPAAANIETACKAFDSIIIAEIVMVKGNNELSIPALNKAIRNTYRKASAIGGCSEHELCRALGGIDGASNRAFYLWQAYESVNC